MENNLIEEIPEGAFNQSQSLNVISLRHNRLDETRIAPLAWFNNRLGKNSSLHRMLQIVNPVIHFLICNSAAQFNSLTFRLLALSVLPLSPH